MANCPKCGKELEEGKDKCPICDIENNSEANTIEEVTVDSNSVFSLDEQTNPNQETEIPKELPAEPKVEEVTVSQENTILTGSVNIQEEVNNDETTISNNTIETVSVDASSLSLEEEKPTVKEIEIPEMPEPEIGEINPELLGNIYDEAERINNEKIEVKRQQELAELELKRQEEEAKKLAQAQAGKPDLLAGRIPEDVSTEPIPKKKKGKAGKVILILLVLSIIAFAAYYFFVLK